MKARLSKRREFFIELPIGMLPSPFETLGFARSSG